MPVPEHSTPGLARRILSMNISLKRYGSLLAHYLRPQWKRALLLALLLLTSIGLQLLNPQILRYFIDTAASGGSSRSLLIAAALFLAAGLINQGLSTWAIYVGADVGWTATNLLRIDLARHCLALDMSFHNERTPGELIERIDGDVTALSNFFSQFVVKVLGSGLLVIGVVALLFQEDIHVGFALLAYALLAVVVLHRTRNIAVESTTEERQASADLLGFVEERLNGLDDIRANGGGGYVMHRFHGVIRQMYRKGRRAWVMRGVLWVVIIGLFTFGDVIAFGMGIYLFKLGAITLGTVYLFFQYTEMLRQPLEQITQQLQDLQKAGASIGRVDDLLRISTIMQDGSMPLPSSGPLAIEFEKVSFAYGEKGTVLKDLRFRLEPGTVLGLLGRTGSGKTTITRLLFRLYDATSGSIRLGEVDLRDVRLGSLRRRVAMVTQEVQLFHATVRDNLTFFDRSIPEGRIEEVIENLGLSDWYASMPQGLDTMLATGGGGLSAGEAQLLAFTRVFLQDPGVVILDEPSSRMDLATERLLERAMQGLVRNRTAIINAHRLSPVARADEIMVMENGHIGEHGRREELAADPSSRLYSLLRAGLEEVEV
jgi:ABC-type multidrug transport system fused ATPase/permease subunit